MGGLGAHGCSSSLRQNPFVSNSEWVDGRHTLNRHAGFIAVAGYASTLCDVSCGNPTIINAYPDSAIEWSGTVGGGQSQEAE